MADMDHPGSLARAMAGAVRAPLLGPGMLGRSATGEVIDVPGRLGLVVTAPGVEDGVMGRRAGRAGQ
ncbi:hypothetical protein OG749_18625 [Streptomyces nojiriensis]|uniref:hypothetical protein n=1 Tax=Streptomyces nojiriensis TaxID=66374 RepID=UPI002E184F56